MATASQRKSKDTSPRQMVLWGVACLGLAVGAYFYLHHAEQVGGEVTLPVIIWPVYRMIGTWGIVGVISVLGLLGVAMGVSELRAAKNKTQAAAEGPSADQA